MRKVPKTTRKCHFGRLGSFEQFLGFCSKLIAPIDLILFHWFCIFLLMLFDTPLDRSAKILKLAIFWGFGFFWAQPRGLKTFFGVEINFYAKSMPKHSKICYRPPWEKDKIKSNSPKNAMVLTCMQREGVAAQAQLCLLFICSTDDQVGFNSKVFAKRIHLRCGHSSHFLS